MSDTLASRHDLITYANFPASYDEKSLRMGRVLVRLVLGRDGVGRYVCVWVVDGLINTFKYTRGQVGEPVEGPARPCLLT